MKNIKKENIEILALFQMKLGKEKDREGVLMVASFFESEFERMLKDKLVGDQSFKNELFEKNGPLDTFSSKIKMSYSLGLISKETMTNLDLLIQIKNEFKKNRIYGSFADSELGQLSYSLISSFYERNEVAPRKYFNNCMLGTLTAMHVGFEIEKFKEKEEPHFTGDQKAETIMNLTILADMLFESEHFEEEEQPENEEEGGETIKTIEIDKLANLLFDVLKDQDEEGSRLN